MKKRKNLGYHVADSVANHRAKASSTHRSEEMILTPMKRAKTIETARDSQRNFSLMAWLVRCHLDYTTSFQFRSRSGDRTFDRVLEKAFSRWAMAVNCDQARRHTLAKIIRQHRGGVIVDGDHAILKVRGGRLQLFESDRIARGDGAPKQVNDFGLVLDDYGAALQFALCMRDRSNGNLKHAALVNAADVVYFGNFERGDQVRGISPLVSALMQQQDLYETLDYTLIKSKLHALFGLIIKRDPAFNKDGELNYLMNQASAEEKAKGRQDEYEIEARPGFVLQMKPGDGMDLIESKNPSTEFQNFTELEIRLILAALGMPYTMFSSAGASWSGMNGDIQKYKIRANVERDDCKESLYQISDWILPILVGRGIRLPDGITIEHILANYEWSPTGSFVLDPSKESAGNVIDVQSGFRSRQMVCAGLGLDFFDVIDDLAEEQKYAEKKGVALATIPLNIRTTIDNSADNSASQSNNTNQGQ